MVHILKTTIPFNTTQPCSATRLPLRPSGGGHPRVPAPAPPGLGEDPAARLPLQAHRPRLRAGPATPRHRQQSGAGEDQVTLIPALSDTTLMKVRVLGRPGIDTTFQHESRRYFPTRPCSDFFGGKISFFVQTRLSSSQRGDPVVVACQHWPPSFPLQR